MINDEQYQVLAARRLATDGMMWQTPVLSLTAQAFLFTIALGHDTSQEAKLISASLALAASLASLQLMAKHRHHELRDSQLLRAYEANKGLRPIHGKPEQSPLAWHLTLSSFVVWAVMLSVFASAAFGVVVGVLAAWK